MTLEAPIVRSDATAKSTGRWGQLACGVVSMVMIANLQYGWTLFVNPIDQKYHWGVPAIQVAFSVFIATKPGWCRSKVGSLIVLARVWLLLLVASSWPSRGRSIPSQTRFRFFTPPPQSAVSARVLFTALASPTRSNGFPTGVG